jgi:hypothetical protein
MANYNYNNRYIPFILDGNQTVVPYVNLPVKATDKKYIYKSNMSRLDKVSQQYYGSPYFGWLILQANPEFSGLEWNIPDGAILNIPYPLIASLQDYKVALDTLFFYYGR